MAKLTYPCCSRHVQPNIECCCVAKASLSQREHQLVSTILEDTVSLVLHRALSLAGVWLLCVHLIGDRVIKVQLRRKLITLTRRRIGANLKVDVDRSALVPAGIDG